MDFQIQERSRRQAAAAQEFPASTTCSLQARTHKPVHNPHMQCECSRTGLRHSVCPVAVPRFQSNSYCHLGTSALEVTAPLQRLVQILMYILAVCNWAHRPSSKLPWLLTYCLSQKYTQNTKLIVKPQAPRSPWHLVRTL